MTRMTRPGLAKALASLAFAVALPNSAAADPAGDLQGLADKLALQPDTEAGSADPAPFGLAADPVAPAGGRPRDTGPLDTGTSTSAAPAWRFPANATELADYARQSLAGGDTHPPVRNDACDLLARLATQATPETSPSGDAVPADTATTSADPATSDTVITSTASTEPDTTTSKAYQDLCRTNVEPPG